MVYYQNEIVLSEGYYELVDFFAEIKDKKVFLVCDSSYECLRVGKYIDCLLNVVKFSDFTPNPDYESVKNAVSLFRKEHCNVVFAVGGGSAIDLAKCVKLYAEADDCTEYFKQKVFFNNIELVVMPTTAGTGSEATRFAVIYYKGEKQSIVHNSILPSTVIFDASTLESLPDYQKKSTILDALCHSLESFWSINSTEESKKYSREALRIIIDNMDAYLSGDNNVNNKIFKAANLAGKAINISQTTAGHAMCYKLTSLYGISHGHAAAMCVRKLLPYMTDNTNKCVDRRGEEYLRYTFSELAIIAGCKNTAQLCRKIDALYKRMEFPKISFNPADISTLAKSVNTTRLKNNPVHINTNSIKLLYKQILSQG